MRTHSLSAGFLLLASLAAGAVPAVRLKDIATIRGVRSNQLVGVGLVTGLAGRGDSSNSELMKRAVAVLVGNFGITIDPAEVRSRNCAVVTVSAEVPPFVREGDRVDVRVGSLGDARSLADGILLQTPLKAANGQVYLLAQGRVAAGASGTAGTVRSGGIVEREILSTYVQGTTVAVILRNADFVTASAVAEAVRAAFPSSAVRPVDASMIEVEIPPDRQQDPVGFIASLESVAVTPDASGKVVIDTASGIIVFGEQVRIGKVAVSYSGTRVEVSPLASVYGTGSGQQPQGSFAFGEYTTVEELVSALQSVGLETAVIIELLKAIDRAGALYGTLILM